jgi:DNA-binding CsgD family transcriptional regulator
MLHQPTGKGPLSPRLVIGYKVVAIDICAPYHRNLTIKPNAVMLPQQAIARTALRILAYINEGNTPPNPDYYDEIAAVLYNMHRVLPQCLVMTCPVQHKSFFYVSDNCRDIIGHDPDFLSSKQPDHLVSLIHETDLPDMMACLSYCESLVVNIPPDQHQQIRCIFNYRIRHADGHYMIAHDEKAALRLKDGTTIYISIIRDISLEKTFTGTKVEVFRMQGKMIKIGECFPLQTSKKLSKRENDLITLIRQGLTTKEIAWQLNISHNTVRNIRSRMFEKYQVNNVVELLNRALPSATG